MTNTITALQVTYILEYRLKTKWSSFSQRALHWRTNRMIDDEYDNFSVSNLHLRVQIKNELYEMSIRLMMKGI